MFDRKLVVPALAVLGLGAAAVSVYGSGRELKPAPVAETPARTPYPRTVAGAGLVEAASENIAVAAHRAGVVTAVHVRPGARVHAGDALFTVDDAAARAALDAASASVAVAAAAVRRLEALPRPEDVPAARARLDEARAVAADAVTQRDNVEALSDARAVSDEERARRRHAAAAAEARAAAAAAELARLTAGAWAQDLGVARAELSAARAREDAARVELERHTVRAPVEGEVLRCNVRPGEFAAAGPQAEPLVLLGDTRDLRVRVDVDENDAWRVRPGAAAVGSPRGNGALRAPLRFVRVDPYVLPKKSLTGGSGERVDTRVLQVLYAFDRSALPVYIGQQIDVFIESADLASGPAREGGR